ncbi:hypothetical protein [Methanohalophilus mahii]|uniref:Uncharacterized protein n=1 Tax=Methanohalophilus mahii (strain ATCC 35705 / DSM 5219 / SLP) TaxID=547558 RepID=D5EBS1_METMS|nr:hypothetical protein [Methanohalophilus mahii]ADE36622.1 hypothetical protein Mmah_1115 [Methanohalophilus mahii DSM 5219]
MLNDNSGGIVAIATVVLVVVTIVYAWLTHETVEQSKKQQKAAYIEKQLEKLYYPLDDVINSNYMFYLIDMNAYIEEENLGCLNPNTKWHDIDDLVQYQHLASSRLEKPLNELLEMLRKFNPQEAAEGTHLKHCVNELKQIVAQDIKELKEELHNLNY